LTVESTTPATPEVRDGAALASSHLHALARIVLAVNRTHDLQKAMQQVVAATIAELDFDAGGVYVVDEDGAKATVRHQLFLPPSFLDEVGVVDITASPYDAVFLHGRPLFFEHYERMRPETAATWGFKSAASVPVFFEDRVVGALNVASYSRHTFTDDERILLSAAGREAGFAIAKAEGERRLAEREADLQRFFDLSRDMLFVADAADGTILHSNPRVCETLGYDYETLLGMNLTELHPSCARTEVARVVKEMLAGRLDVCTLPLVGRDGEQIPVETRVNRGSWRGRDSIFGISRDLRTERLLRAALTAMMSVLEVGDASAGAHGRRVARLAEQLASALGWPESATEPLSLAALVHDIGMSSVPSMIRCKPAPLSDDEKALIRMHPLVGRELLSSLDDLGPLPRIVLQHHELLDGSGYPHGSSGDEILPAARIVCVAEILATKSSHMPYRPAHSLEAAVTFVRRMDDGRLDPDVVAAGLKLYHDGALDWLRTTGPAS
jgi:PAS domain S-box-containing protein